MAARSASQILHTHIGAPAGEGCVVLASPGPCWVCGGHATRGLDRERWMGGNYANQNRAAAPASTHVCEACVFVMSRISPVPGRPAQEGKKFGANFRNVSHLYDAASSPIYANASKGEKPAILAFLRAQHDGEWFATIADSGQKHMLPWAPVNPGGARGRVLFEEAEVSLPRTDAGWVIINEAVELLTAGATKDEIERGEYTPRAWSLCGPAIRAFEARWSGERGGHWFALVVWLAQRDEARVEERMAAEKSAKEATKKNAKAQRKRSGGASDAHGDAHPRGAERVPAEPAGERDEALGSDALADAQRDATVRDGRGVDHGDVPRAQPRVAQQLGLFGDARAR